MTMLGRPTKLVYGGEIPVADYRVIGMDPDRPVRYHLAPAHVQFSLSLAEAQEASWFLWLLMADSDPKVVLAIRCKREVEAMFRRAGQ
jgi:hypothetical protein